MDAAFGLIVFILLVLQIIRQREKAKTLARCYWELAEAASRATAPDFPTGSGPILLGNKAVFHANLMIHMGIKDAGLRLQRLFPKGTRWDELRTP